MRYADDQRTEARTTRLPDEDSDDVTWDGLGVSDRVAYEGPRHFAADRRGGRPTRQDATLRDHARGFGWSRMSWKSKLAVVLFGLWVMGTINQRLEQDRTFQTGPISSVQQEARSCTEDELLDTKSLTCVHIEAIASNK